MPPNKYIHTHTYTHTHLQYIHTYIEYLEIGGQQAPVFVHGMHQDERHIYLLVLNVIPVLEQVPPLTSTLAFIPTYIQYIHTHILQHTYILKYEN